MSCPDAPAATIVNSAIASERLTRSLQPGSFTCFSPMNCTFILPGGPVLVPRRQYTARLWTVSFVASENLRLKCSHTGRLASPRSGHPSRQGIAAPRTLGPFPSSPARQSWSPCLDRCARRARHMQFSIPGFQCPAFRRKDPLETAKSAAPEEQTLYRPRVAQRKKLPAGKGRCAAPEFPETLCQAMLRKQKRIRLPKCVRPGLSPRLPAARILPVLESVRCDTQRRASRLLRPPPPRPAAPSRRRCLFPGFPSGRP